MPLPIGLISAGLALAPQLLSSRRVTDAPQVGAGRAMTPTVPPASAPGSFDVGGLLGGGAGSGGSLVSGLVSGATDLIGDIGGAFGLGGGSEAKAERRLRRLTAAGKDISDAQKRLARTSNRAARAQLFARTGDFGALTARQRAKVLAGRTGFINRLGASQAIAEERRTDPATIQNLALAVSGGRTQQQFVIDKLRERGMNVGPLRRGNIIQRSRAQQPPASAQFAASLGGPMATGVRSPFRGQLVSTGSPLDGFTNPLRTAFDNIFGQPVNTLPQMIGEMVGLEQGNLPADCGMLFKPPTTVQKQRPNSLVSALNANNDRVYWRYVGKPVLFSGDMTNCKRVARTAQRAQRGLPTRRTATRRGRR